MESERKIFELVFIKVTGRSKADLQYSKSLNVQKLLNTRLTSK